MRRLANPQRHPVVLEDGTTLAAAGTEGSVKEVETVSEADQRRIDDGVIVELGAVARPQTNEPPQRPASETTQESTEAAGTTRRGGR